MATILKHPGSPCTSHVAHAGEDTGGSSPIRRRVARARTACRIVLGRDPAALWPPSTRTGPKGTLDLACVCCRRSRSRNLGITGCPEGRRGGAYDFMQPGREIDVVTDLDERRILAGPWDAPVATLKAGSGGFLPLPAWSARGRQCRPRGPRISFCDCPVSSSGDRWLTKRVMLCSVTVCSPEDTCISDRVESMLHGPNLTSYARGVEAVISCGDLPFVHSNTSSPSSASPVYYVLGNHDRVPKAPSIPVAAHRSTAGCGGKAVVRCSRAPGCSLLPVAPTSTPSATCAAGRGRSRSESVAGASSASQAGILDPLPPFRPWGPGGCGTRRLRVFCEPHRQASTTLVAARDTFTFMGGSGAGQAEGRDQDRQRLRTPNPRRLTISRSAPLLAGPGDCRLDY